MRITLEFSENLLNQTMKATHVNTKTGVIVFAQEELVRKSEIIELKRYKGKIDLAIDINTVRSR